MTKTPHANTLRMKAQEQVRSPLLWIWVGGIAASIAFLLLLSALVGPSPPRRIRLAGGLPGGAYHAFAERYREALSAQGIDVEVHETDGSLQNLELLKRAAVDVAFVQSGTRRGSPDPQPLRGIASLFHEPLWIFHKGREQIDTLQDLRGKRLAVGNPQSGTFAVCEQLLALNGVAATNTVLLPLDMHAARDALLRDEIDYAFFTASPEAEVVRELMTDPRTRLVNIRRHRAYVRNVLFVTDVEIAEGTFDIRQNFPREDITVLSTVAQLVCREDLHPAIVELLLRTAQELHSGPTLLDQGGTFPSMRNLEYPVHEAAADYFRSGPSLLARYLPFQVANLLKKLLVVLIPVVTLLIPLLKIAPGIYRAVMRRRIHRHYQELERIERAFLTATSPAQFEQCAHELDALLEHVETGIDVPSTFRNEEFDLRVHTAHVRRRLDQVRAARPGC